MNRTDIREALANVPVGQEVLLGGWVRTLRTSKGGFSFLTINDGSCMAAIQVVADAKLPNYESEIVRLAAGCSVHVRGTLVASQGKGQRVELQAAEVKVLGTAETLGGPAGDMVYPIQQKRHTMEFLRTVAHLRARTNTFGAVARVRNAISAAIHEFFQTRGFVYINTPIITASDCEGAGQMFRVTTLDVANPPKTPEGAIDFDKDFFGKSAYLTVSGQLEGETYACALSKVYTFGPTFRAENSNTPRHLSEFWMVEPEVAFTDLAGDADLAEAFLKHIFRSVLKNCQEDMAFFNQFVDNTLIETLTHIAESEFVRLPYTEAVDILKKSGKAWEFPVDWGTDLQTEHERFLTEQTFKKPVILMDYPARIKAFYMRLNDDGKTVAATDLLCPQIGEVPRRAIAPCRCGRGLACVCVQLVGGSQREERFENLVKRMEEMHVSVRPRQPPMAGHIVRLRAAGMEDIQI